jgi:hypothetical protein
MQGDYDFHVHRGGNLAWYMRFIKGLGRHVARMGEIWNASKIYAG